MGDPTAEREQWGSRIGLILAAAGNAIGIGNLLRFPNQAASNGGGAFMIPYVVSLLIFGLPMMWIAWTIGRRGGQFGHGTLPGQFEKLWPNRSAKYLGMIGVALPLLFCLYYTYIEAWCLGYSYFSVTGNFTDGPGRTVDLKAYFDEFLGTSATHSYFSGMTAAFVFLLITLLLNVWVLYKGVAKGIELLAKIAMPLLLLFCVVLAVRVFTMGKIKGTALDGLSFLWTPDFAMLAKPGVWIAAAGQIFFTLSIGFGSMECYASYLKANDDVTLNGLTTASTNEFVEVIFGSMIAIPAAAVFFGAGAVGDIAKSGTFDIGMVSMPEILRNTAGVEVFGAIWFLLLFFAAFTSSVAVAQPVVAFLQDELKMKRETSVTIVGLVWFLGTIPVIWFYKYGVFDELDFWAGTIGLVVCSIVEVILFAWVFGIRRGWEEMHRGADIQVPQIFGFVMKYVTPFALIAIFCWWFYDAIKTDQLVPQPKITWGVANRQEYEGSFEKWARTDLRTEEGKKAQKKALEEVGEIEKGVKSAVREAHRDLSAWAEVSVDAQGNAKVTSFHADPALAKNLDGPKFERWLSLQEWHFKKGKLDQAVAAPAKVSIELTGLNKAPFVWLTRIIILLMGLAFLVLIRVAWRERPAPEGGVS